MYITILLGNEYNSDKYNSINSYFIKYIYI